ncbi:MAG TPA: hypothetical protein VLA17_17680 [Candidatus Limnocylindria bacterium]|nr:hypothetical protein [Candidatus Limnocylindria bacterium]
MSALQFVELWVEVEEPQPRIKALVENIGMKQLERQLAQLPAH